MGETIFKNGTVVTPEWLNEVDKLKEVDFTAHLAETVQKTDKTINVPTDYSTVQQALDSLKYTWIPSDVTVTIQIDEGTYTHDSTIVVNHPCGNQIQIVGATPVTASITSVDTDNISGSAEAYSVPVEVDSTDNINVGDYVIIKETEGETEDSYDHAVYQGIWEITAIGDGQIIVTNTHREDTFPEVTVTAGTAVILKTILKFNDCPGVSVINSRLGLLDKIALVGDGIEDEYAINRGLVVGRDNDDLNNTLNLSPASCLLGDNFGVSSFGSTGVYIIFGGCLSINNYNSTVESTTCVVSSGNEGSGFYVELSGLAYLKKSISTGNGRQGYGVGHNSSVYAPYAISSGNNGNGFVAEINSYILADYCISINNGGSGYYSAINSSIQSNYSSANSNGAHGYISINHSFINTHYGKAANNGLHGFHADNGSSIEINYGTADNNSSNGFCSANGSSIDADHSSSTNNGNIGYYAYDNSLIEAQKSTCSNNGSTGYYALNASSIEASSSKSESNTGIGYYATNNSFIMASSSEATSNTSKGYYANKTSTIIASSSTATDNEKDYYAAYMAFIYCDDYQDTESSFSPSIDTQGNNYALIAT